MEPNYLKIDRNIESLIIYQKDNNLDKLDNLDELPAAPGVYAICGRVNDKPANCRYIGETDNIREAIKSHFRRDEPYECLREFMQSIKIKHLLYELTKDSNSKSRVLKKEEWEKEFKPTCNKELNEVH
jgi:excinuclease UvrABC nuclease subunit